MAGQRVKPHVISALCCVAILLQRSYFIQASGLPPGVDANGRQLRQFSIFLPPTGFLQQNPGPGDVGHNSAAAQPQCRAFWDQDAGVTCFINFMWLASSYLQPSSLLGRGMLYIAARQASCNQHRNISNCLADRDNYCAPITSPLTGFDCVVAADWTFAFDSLFNQGGAFSCPGSYVERLIRCRSMHKIMYHNGNLTQAGAVELCETHGCVYEPAFDDCWANETMPVQRRQAMGDCPTARYWLQQMQLVLASKSYTTCPYQTGAFDAINRVCTMSIDTARATDTDDMVTQANQVNEYICVRQALCVAKCEGFGNFTLAAGQPPMTAVLDEALLQQFRETHSARTAATSLSPLYAAFVQAFPRHVAFVI